MSHPAISTRLAANSDIDRIISISTEVQDALTASESLQIIGPLRYSTVLSAVEEGRCFVATDGANEVVGCVMIRPMDDDIFPPSPNFSMAGYPKPWRYLHSMMLVPEAQGNRYGLKLFNDVMAMLAPSGGTVLLDCWAGNDKLRSFYARAGCRYVATVPEEDFEVAVFVRILDNEV